MNKIFNIQFQSDILPIQYVQDVQYIVGYNIQWDTAIRPDNIGYLSDIFWCILSRNV